MDSSLIILIISALLSLLCCGGTLFLFVLILGFVLLRRRGQTDVSARDAMNAGVESVSQVFVRGQSGLEAADDD
jgi:hypothetical protein